MSFDVGTVDGTQASFNGVQYDRASVAPWVPEGVPTIFIQVGRTPHAIVAGGYHAEE